MRKGRKVFILILCAILIVVLLPVFLSDRGPSYNGRSLHQWLLQISPRNPALLMHRDEAREAIRAMGTNSLPFLLKWITYEQRPSRTRNSMRWLLDRVPPLTKITPLRNWVYVDMQEARAEAVPYAFEMLGSIAAPAIPELTKLASIPRVDGPYSRAVDSLVNIGPVALPAILTVVTNADAAARFYATTAITAFGTNAVPAIPVLIRCLSDPATDVACAAVETLSELPIDAHITIAALTNVLQDPRAIVRRYAIDALGRMEGEAQPALPSLRTMLNDADPSVKRAATNALLQIAPDILMRDGPH